MWSQKELFDGTYSFEDLWDMHEHLDVEFENSNRRNKAIEKD